MATCEKCGTIYLGRECHNCNDQSHIIDMRNAVQNNNDAITIKKSHVMIVIAGALSIIALVMVYKEYKEYKQEQEVKEALQMLNKELAPYNEMLKKSFNDMNKMNEQFRKSMEKK